MRERNARRCRLQRQLRTRGPLIELDPAEVEKALAITAFAASWWRSGGEAHAAARHGRHFIHRRFGLVKGYAQSAPSPWANSRCAAGAEHGARTLAQGHHVAHCGDRRGIKRRAARAADSPDSLLDPDAIAASYLQLWRSRAAPGPRARAAAWWRSSSARAFPTTVSQFTKAPSGRL